MSIEKSVKTDKTKKNRGRLRIGDDWNAITIIALSQNNPLKAIAEFVENSIDAQSRQITIIRGKIHGQHYLKVIDDGSGIPCSEDGTPNFAYVATHICDSIKRRLKQEGALNIQGEFGIGLLSFWTVGHKLTMLSSGADGKIYQMAMEKGKPGYSIMPRAHLLPMKGVQLIIAPLLAGIRSLSGEKIQLYLAAELRDRIRHSGVKIRIMDHTGHAEFDVEPRRYAGQLLHNLPAISTPLGDVYTEIYLSERGPENAISLFRSGTRVLPAITTLDIFQSEPWTSGYFQGIIDAPFLHLTPGTRDGIIHDEKFAQLCEVLNPLRGKLEEIAQEQRNAEEERASRNILRSVHKAFQEALMVLPPEEYDWFDIHKQGSRAQVKPGTEASQSPDESTEIKSQAFPDVGQEEPKQKQFFEFAGALFSVRISPASALVPVSGKRSLRAVAMDKSRWRIETGIAYSWSIAEGSGRLEKHEGEMNVFYAPEEPGLTRLKVSARQGEVVCEAECVITTVDALIKSESDIDLSRKGLPGYTLESAPGQPWRSKYDTGRNLIIINKGHRDYVYAVKQNARKVRYICRLYAKELVSHNFRGLAADQLLEHMVELSLYAEDNLK